MMVIENENESKMLSPCSVTTETSIRKLQGREQDNQQRRLHVQAKRTTYYPGRGKRARSRFEMARRKTGTFTQNFGGVLYWGS